MSRILIAGFGNAGYAALISIRRNDPSSEIVIIDPSEYDRVHTRGIPYALQGLVPFESLHSDINLESLRAKRVVASVTGIIPGEKTVLAKTDSREHCFTYDSLILATGQMPLIPEIPGISSRLDTDIFRLNDTGVYDSIIRAASRGGRAAVIGAGPSGLETTFALKGLCRKVTLFDSDKHVLTRFLDPELSEVVEQAMSDNGIIFMPGRKVDGISVDKRLSGLTAAGELHEADFAVVTAGHVPRTEPAVDSGISFDSNGISVDSYLCATFPDIYAAGACISCPSALDSSSFRPGLAASSRIQGTVAGLNAIGGRVPYRGSPGAFLTRLAGLEVSSTGYTTSQAQSRGYDPVSGMVRRAKISEGLQSGDEISLKIIFDRKSGKILGAQAAGNCGCAERINMVSTAIEFDIPIDDAGKIELGYYPFISQLYDPLFRAIDFGLKKR